MASFTVCCSRVFLQVAVILLLVTVLSGAEAETKKKQKNKVKIGKDITDYTDADVHRLLDQWDVSKRNRSKRDISRAHTQHFVHAFVHKSLKNGLFVHKYPHGLRLCVNNKCVAFL